MDIITKLKEGNQHHQAGRLETARAIYEKILRHSPRQPDALHLSGLVAHQQGDSDEGLHRIGMAIAIQPGNAVFHQNLCAILCAAGRWDESIQVCRAFVVQNPESTSMQALLGSLHMTRKNWQQAAQCFMAAIALDPTDAEIHHNLGVAYQETERLETAIQHYRHAILLQPKLAEAHYNLANALRLKDGVNETVIEAYRTALDIRSDYADASFNLAKAFDELERIDEAILNYAHTLGVQPDHIDAHHGLGNAFLKQGRYQAATEAYEQTIRINPAYPEGYYNLGLVAKQQGRMGQAAEYVNQCLVLNPEFGDASSLMVQIYQQACAWADLEPAGMHLDVLTEKDLAAGRCPSEQPFLNFTRHADPALNLRVARAWSTRATERIAQMGGPLAHNSRERKDGKLVVGYVSERFRNAATAHLIRQMFALHDREQFEVYAYSFGTDDGSLYRQRIAEDADRFIDIRHLGDLDAARRIQADGVDILVDLMGYMKHNRIGIFAFRPAPVQVEYLGYPGTTGAEFMDYLIADHEIVPAGDAGFFSECLVRMPHCYQLNDNTQPVSTKVFEREACGLPEKAFVYCSFNTDYKIDRSMFQVWMRILKQVADSVLWLLVRSRETKSNLVQAAASAGVSRERLVFAESLKKDEHLARIKLADLALDTRIVNGHTTTSDCLWVDLPVVTLKGTHFPSRVSASLLKALEMPELVCSDIDAYESLAVKLAVDWKRLAKIRHQLAHKKMTAPLFDSTLTVRNLEKAYLRMWDNHTQKRGPQAFAVGQSEAADDRMNR